jgi:PPK2 family polyphosphate:nucleotide phosphotransferase
MEKGRGKSIADNDVAFRGQRQCCAKVLAFGMKKQPLAVETKIRLSDFDPGYEGGWRKDEGKIKAGEYVKRIGELQELLYANSTHAVLLLFQGMDASGKDGSVRSVLKDVNPAGVETANFKVPSTEERAHDFLWRIHKAVPRFGNIGVFNRSHYEAVLAERVLALVPEKVWSKRFAQIVSFEEMLAANNIVLLKFFLHLSKDEQRKRLEERLKNPKKRWKFSSGDLDTRQKWDDYEKAYEEVLNRTSHPCARWHIVPADRNWYRNLVISQTVYESLEALGMNWPEPKEDLSKITID